MAFGRAVMEKKRNPPRRKVAEAPRGLVLGNGGLNILNTAKSNHCQWSLWLYEYGLLNHIWQGGTGRGILLGLWFKFFAADLLKLRKRHRT
jgi:hypothetical protein